MQRMVQGVTVPDVSKSKKVIINHKDLADSSFDDLESSIDQNVPKNNIIPQAIVVDRNLQEENIALLIDAKLNSINDNFKSFFKEIKKIKEEIRANSNISSVDTVVHTFDQRQVRYSGIYLHLGWIV